MPLIDVSDMCMYTVCGMQQGLRTEFTWWPNSGNLGSKVPAHDMETVSTVLFTQ